MRQSTNAGMSEALSHVYYAYRICLPSVDLQVRDYNYDEEVITEVNDPCVTCESLNFMAKPDTVFVTKYKKWLETMSLYYQAKLWRTLVLPIYGTDCPTKKTMSNKSGRSTLETRFELFVAAENLPD